MAYVVGQITVTNPELWAEYKAQVPATLLPWGGKLAFRGKQAAALAGGSSHPDIVAIHFPNMDAINDWFSSAAYQKLIPLRQQAADVVLLAYETED